MIVVDCAALVNALTNVAGTEDLRAVMASEELNAPALLDFEVVSVLRGLTLGGHLTTDRSEEALADFDDLRVRRWPSSAAFRQRSFQLRDSLSAYDAAYVVLAEALNCTLLTRDERLARASGDLIGVVVR